MHADTSHSGRTLTLERYREVVELHRPFRTTAGRYDDSELPTLLRRAVEYFDAEATDARVERSWGPNEPEVRDRLGRLLTVVTADGEIPPEVTCLLTLAIVVGAAALAQTTRHGETLAR